MAVKEGQDEIHRRAIKELSQLEKPRLLLG